MSYTMTMKGEVPIAKRLEQIVIFYLPNGGVIYDPACGETKHQLANLLLRKNDSQLTAYLEKKSKEPQALYQIIQSDLKPTGDFVASARALPLRNKIADMTIWDPPFVPFQRDDKRGKDYGIDQDRSVEDVFNFYGLETYAELARVTRKYVVVRGMDFYFPVTSEKFYPFYEFALKDAYKAGLTVHAIYPYKTNPPKLGLYRWRLRHYVRPIQTHSYLAVLKVKGAGE